NSVAVCFGRGEYHRLGSGDDSNRLLPTLVATSVRFAQVSAGWMHTCGLTNDAAVYCWGWGAGGQVGRQPGIYPGLYVRYPSSTLRVNDSYVTAGGLHTCSIGNDQLAYCWGDNGSGELGNPEAGSRNHEPTGVA